MGLFIQKKSYLNNDNRFFLTVAPALRIHNKKMRTIILLSLFVLCSSYTDVNDKENEEALVNNPTELKKHVSCYLERGPCDKDTQMYKTHIREAVNDYCRECNDTERHMFKIFLKGLQDHLPDDYELYKKKYDPSGTHFDALIASLAKY